MGAKNSKTRISMTTRYSAQSLFEMGFTQEGDRMIAPKGRKKPVKDELKATKKKKPSKDEEKIQLRVCEYLKAAYPETDFFTDTAAGMKLTIGQATKAKKMRSSRALPDIFISEPRRNYHGLYIELKREGERVFLVNGDISADKHIKEQAAVIERLNKKGYYASFAVGFNKAKEIIDWYLLIN